jgi:hypothetical protein
MASTYVNDLRLNEMATGDASGSWGTVTNTNLELIGEAFSYGTETIGDADSTLTIADGAADAARSFYLKITSSVDLTTTRIVTLAPNTVSKVWMIENATTGSQVITIKQGSGATINVPNGQVKMISTDGAGSGGAVLDLLVDVDLTGTTTLVNLDVSGTLGVTGVLTATSLDISGDIDVDGTTNLDVVDIDGAVDMASTLLVTGVLTTTAATVSNGGGQFNGTVTVGVDDTGYDVKFFGATTGKSLLWDESADSLIVTGTTTLVGTTNLDAVDIDGATQIDATVTVGVDDTGYDVKFFGATAGAYMLWDESADDLILGGAAGLSVNSTALVTGVLTTTAATVHTGGITMPDNAKAIFGTGSDLEIYFNGSDGIINESVAGNLLIQGDNIYLQNSAATASYLRGVDGGAIDLRYAGNEKLATTATGIDVTGTVVADGLRLDGTACIGLNVAPSEFGGGVATITLKGTTSAKSGAIKFIDDNDTSVASIFAQNDINYGLSIGTLGGTGDFIRFHTGALGTERMRIDSSGAVTMPLQPAFLARPLVTQANIPASTTVTVVFGTEVFDQNSDFASNTFTAPVTGKYQFSYSLYLTNIDTAASYYEIYLETSNRAYAFVIDPNFASDLNYLTLTQSVLADMDAGDTAYVTIRQQTGTAQTDIMDISFFSGYLVA